MSACRQCGRDVLPAVTPDGERVVLDAVKVPGGEYAAWTHRDGLVWTHHARRMERVDALGGAGFRLHECEPAGQQLELGGAA